MKQGSHLNPGGSHYIHFSHKGYENRIEMDFYALRKLTIVGFKKKKGGETKQQGR